MGTTATLSTFDLIEKTGETRYRRGRRVRGCGGCKGRREQTSSFLEMKAGGREREIVGRGKRMGDAIVNGASAGVSGCSNCR
jgi:hypothetical protein